MTANYYPDGLTAEDITTLQLAVDEELRHQGYPVPDWPDTPRIPSAPTQPTPRPTRRTPHPQISTEVEFIAPETHPWPSQPQRCRRDTMHPDAHNARRRDVLPGTRRQQSQKDSAVPPLDRDVHAGPRVHTPAQAAELLTVSESWLRRQAGQRRIPCTFLGRHLRFSDRDLAAIVTAGARPATSSGRRGTRPRRK
jgi:excisionase family DNA binding protein